MNALHKLVVDVISGLDPHGERVPLAEFVRNRVAGAETCVNP